MSVEENKELVRRWMEELWNQRRLDVIDELAAENLRIHTIHHDSPGTLDVYKKIYPRFLAIMPDFHITIEDMFGEGDRVAVRVVQTGTHTGEGGSIPPSNKSITQSCLAIYRCVDGKIVEGWAAERDWVETLRTAAQSKEHTQRSGAAAVAGGLEHAAQ